MRPTGWVAFAGWALIIAGIVVLVSGEDERAVGA